MESVPTLLGQLRRPNANVSWGFRLQGGIDYNCPLTVVNLVDVGIAEQIGMMIGDQILKINDMSTENMTHQQAQQAIVKAGNSLDLIVTRANLAPLSSPLAPNNFSQSSSGTFPMGQNSQPAEQPYIVTNDFNNDFTPMSQDAPSFSSSSGISLPQTQPPRAWNTLPHPPGHGPPQSGWRPTIPGRSTGSPSSSPSPKAVSFQLDAPPQGKPTGSQFLQNHGYAPAGKPVAKASPMTPSNWSYGGAPISPVSPTTGIMSTRRAGPGDSIVFNEPDSDFDPICWKCRSPARGSYVQALGRNYCPEHFTCTQCGRRLVNMGFVEESGSLYCEEDFLHFMAPRCAKCSQAIVGPVVTAMDRKWHPHCFVCTHCRQPITSCSFRIGDDKFPYCERDWNDLFLTRCDQCGQSIEPSDRYIDAFQKSFHADCFCCNVCQICLEGMPFYARDGKAYCKNHAHSTAIY